MKVIIISAFDTYLDRVMLLKDYYLKHNNNVEVWLSDFSHRYKKYSKDYPEIDKYIHARGYTRNLSIKRLKSHYDFSREVYKELYNSSQDVIHCLIPANSLTKFVGKYKMKHPNTKVYFDIIDLWPETMPIGKIKTIFPFTIWKNIRDKNLKNSDLIFTECNLFQKILKKEKDSHYHTLYWAKNTAPIVFNNEFEFIEDKLSICYLGSINNIIDIELISNILDECSKYKHVTLHIIGDGEKKNVLLEKLSKLNINVVDHGKLFDFEKKHEIFNQCNYGLNIMKPQVCVGLTMKSLDYLSSGLPLINSILGDTSDLCEKENIGWNLTNQNYKEIVKKICEENSENYLVKRYQTNVVFQKYFTKDAFNKSLNNILK